MKRTLGTLIVLGLIGGAVWLGARSERPAAPLQVETVEDLAQMLSAHGIGCGHADRAVPGMPPRDADYGVCEIGGKPAQLFVFEGSPASMTNDWEPGSDGGWIVGDNWVVTVHDAELAIEAAEALGAEVFHGGTPPSSQATVPRCDEDIPFEPTYLPAGFKHRQVEGAFPGGRLPDDQSSIGGKPHQEQVIAHYRGADGRAIEIRRPGSLFTELALGDDAPTIYVLGSPTSNFGPIGPGGDDFIVQFPYPHGAKPHQWCSHYSLNEYGLSLPELKKVATDLRAVNRTEPRSGETVFYRLHPDRSKIDKYCGAKDRSYVVRHVEIPTGERDVLTRAVRALAATLPRRFADHERDEFRPASRVTSVTVTDGMAVIDLGSMKGMGIVSATCAGVGFIGELSRTVFQFDSVDSLQIHLDGSCKDFGDFMQSGRCDTVLRSEI